MAACPGTTSASQLASAQVPTIMTSTAPEQPVHDTETMCRYPSKKCWNPRALKRNGERHNLCDFHRQKANKNQRRLELKRKARAQASADAESLGKRLRAHKKPRQRTRRAPLSAHLAMKEEARAKQQAEEISRANTAAAAASSSGLTSWFLQDLVLLDGVYDRAGFQAKEEQPSSPMTTSVELQRLPDVMDQEVLDHILQDGQVDAAAVCKSLDTTLGLEALGSLPEGKTSPVDVGESWDSLDFGDYWLTSAPVDHPIMSSEPSVFGVDEDVFVADV
ncbi:hypothetical protein L917_11026 [Phytophthora nicotianae]|uniref:Uncharacterized protein n=4 Tax=Phytophthora nicotianae TaxID=4792 RepID=V9EW59_PHYNI|nr:hypothetical protein F443_11532 [Phytophthora nicotianae P1569]ETL37067.1 hypothetical protein L916_11122 [Phytophthora nicotianae]ETO72248.1 hypothetical protein F444_11603 [Phytophthora nicotianae P1976]KUF64633.1 hypothetical protein AM587_10016893 [Phytophthora nicotianae]ETL90211.1 hypothetical protein L917_11026 [Phytophthora nicotianae]